MTTEEIRTRIGELEIGTTTHMQDFVNCIMELAGKVESLEITVEYLERKLKHVNDTAQRAANEASCLANGIQPD